MTQEAPRAPSAPGAAAAPGGLTEERRLIRDNARAFAMREVLPVANALDPERGEIPMALRDKMADMGYFGILIPEAYGGLGLGCYEYCLVAEQLARAWMSVASIIARGNGGFLREGVRGGDESHLAPLLRRSARGEFLSAVAFSEPNAGSDLAAISCKAERDGDAWVINGAKHWCTFADGADFIALFARTSPPPSPSKRHLGVSAFVVPKPRGELPANCEGAPMPKIGYFGWKTWELAFRDMRLPADALIGEEGKAFYIMTAGLEVARAHTAARSVGLAQGALEDAIEHAKTRMQFGRPLAEFQSVRFRIADMATQVEAARRLLYYVAERIDEGERCDMEASMAKRFASDIAEKVASDAMQILGGAGYTTHHAVERHWRDARLTRIFEGTNEIQSRIIADHLLGRSKDERLMIERAFADLAPPAN